MLKLGIVGSDNSHSIYFSQLANCPEGLNGLRVDGARVVSIWGAERERTEEVAKKGQVPEIVQYPEEMVGKIDAVMVVLRHGGIHYRFAYPFIKAGIPTFVDKPFACSVENARKTIELANETGTFMTSFSTLRYDQSTVEFKKQMEERRPLIGAHIVGSVDCSSEYGGIYFMGIHVVELGQELMGAGVRSVMAFRQNGSINAIVRYSDSRIMHFLFLEQPAYHEKWEVCVYGTHGSSQYTIGEGTNYYYGFKMFLEAVASRKSPLKFEEILESVMILKAIEVSLASKKEIMLQDL